MSEANNCEFNQAALDKALGLDVARQDPLWPVALKLAEACAPENGPELNAKAMLPLLKATDAPLCRGGMLWHSHLQGALLSLYKEFAECAQEFKKEGNDEAYCATSAAADRLREVMLGWFEASRNAGPIKIQGSTIYPMGSE